MKRTLLILLILLPAIGFSQEDPEIIEEIDGRNVVKQNEKYGLMKKSKYIIPAYFDTIYYIDHDYFMVHQNGKMGVFDKKGKMVVPVAYQNINPFNTYEEIFEVFATGIRAVYVTSKHNKLYGGLKAANTLIAKQTEVSLLDWIFFMKDVADSGDSYGFTVEAIIPDTTKMDPLCLRAYRYYANQSVNSTHAEKYWIGYKGVVSSSIYFHKQIESDDQAKKALQFPITGITYEQANLYCKWLTLFHETNEELYLDELHVTFRLPTVAEWEQMAFIGLNEDMKKKKEYDSVNVKGCALFNYVVTSKCSNYEEMVKHNVGKGLCERTSFNPDWQGFYGLYGNAAEMVYEKNICKGGGYCHYAKEAKIENNIPYNGAQPWLGFRYVMEIKIKN
ncbi:MAG: SUMF1/EgtB/PvdO family nonheme iron enzyme [Bacteroidota bacterium]